MAKNQSVYYQRFKTEQERFWEKVDKSGDCWIWIAGKRAGYGLFFKDGRQQNANRVALMYAGVDVPDNADVLHGCDNPSCVNPDHLRVGCPTENMRDAVKRERHTPCRLSMGDIPEIRAMLNNGDTHMSIAKKYGVHRQTISNVASGKTWGYV